MARQKNYQFIDDDNIKLTNMVREGVSVHHLTKLSDHIRLSMQDWADYLHISERTIQRYKKEGKAFDPIYSERIVVIELLYKKGIDIFGASEKFYAWMDSVSIALGGVKPKELLDTTFGITQVYDELGRIEHGIFA
jgi:putative toxin-antitoxin system antitoxin component (TIGR02293 family)